MKVLIYTAIKESPNLVVHVQNYVLNTTICVLKWHKNTLGSVLLFLFCVCLK